MKQVAYAVAALVTAMAVEKAEGAMQRSVSTWEGAAQGRPCRTVSIARTPSRWGSFGIEGRDRPVSRYGVPPEEETSGEQPPAGWRPPIWPVMPVIPVVRTEDVDVILEPRQRRSVHFPGCLTGDEYETSLDNATNPITIFLEGMDFKTMRSTAETLAEWIGIQLPREVRRRRNLTRQWFYNNREAILPLLPLITVQDTPDGN
ncbi:MAG: hypothetical protein LBR78_01825 [Holosporales bacterium]|nr:hypothetical protein [Holosporales bacterium]